MLTWWPWGIASGPCRTLARAWGEPVGTGTSHCCPCTGRGRSDRTGPCSLSTSRLSRHGYPRSCPEWLPAHILWINKVTPDIMYAFRIWKFTMLLGSNARCKIMFRQFLLDTGKWIIFFKYTDKINTFWEMLILTNLAEGLINYHILYIAFRTSLYNESAWNDCRTYCFVMPLIFE